MKIKVKRYCPICGHKLQKWSKHRNGKQRGRCPECRKDRRLTRIDVKERFIEQRFDKGALNTTTVKLSKPKDKSTTTFGRENKVVGSREIHIDKPTTKEHVIILDGAYLGDRSIPIDQKKCCMSLINLTNVIYFDGIESENKDSSLNLIRGIPEPEYVVCDGRYEVILAIKTLWPGAIIQRCMKHIVDGVQRLLTRHPETEAGYVLLHLTYSLGQVNNLETRNIGIKSLNNFETFFRDFLNEMTPYIDKGGHTRSTHTHIRVWRAYKMLETVTKTNHLFNFLNDSLRLVPRTSNLIEGGLHSAMKRLLKVHCGMPLSHQKKVVEHFLVKRMKKPTHFEN